jgi:hypothetical protein
LIHDARYDVAGVISRDLFDSALDDIDLDLQLGGREAAPRDVAARILATLPILEQLDTRPMEWVGIPQTGGQLSGDDATGRTIEELVELVAAGARRTMPGAFTQVGAISCSSSHTSKRRNNVQAPFALPLAMEHTTDPPAIRSH